MITLRNSFQDMLDAQRALDIFLAGEGFGDSPQILTFKKKVATIIETCELLNELEDHKYWKIHKKKNLEKAREEYIDIMHFLLSLFLTRGLDHDSFVRHICLHHYWTLARAEDELDLLLSFVNEEDSIRPTRKGLEIVEICMDLLREVVFSIHALNPDEEARCLYKAMMHHLLLGTYLKFETGQEILDEYMRKNKINWDRKVNRY